MIKFQLERKWTEINFYDKILKKEKIDFKNLVIAIKNTFKNRKTELNIEDITEQLNYMNNW